MPDYSASGHSGTRKKKIMMPEQVQYGNKPKYQLFVTQPKQCDERMQSLYSAILVN